MEPALPKGEIQSELQHRVLRVAARLFAQQGFHAVSIRDIAAECGVSVSTVLYGGRSKQQLLEQILARSFTGHSPWPSILSSFGPQGMDTYEVFLDAYDRIIGVLVQNVVEFPDTRRLWLRLQLDQKDLFKSFETKYTWPLFQHAFELLLAARRRGLIAGDDARLQSFVTSIDWILNGYCTTGTVDFAGNRGEPLAPEGVAALLRYLQDYARAWFPPQGSV